MTPRGYNDVIAFSALRKRRLEWKRGFQLGKSGKERPKYCSRAFKAGFCEGKLKTQRDPVVLQWTLEISPESA
jgi:hypothetical protein